MFLVLAALATAAPVAGSNFPEQPGDIPACDVVTSLPKDVIGHLLAVNPQAAERLLDNVADACEGA